MSSSVERTLPFDFFPRLIDQESWEQISRGVQHRFKALNAFLYDIYHEERLFTDGVVPRQLVCIGSIPCPRRQCENTSCRYSTCKNVML